MKATINRIEMLDILSKVKLAVPSGNGYTSLPVLRSVKLEAGKGKLTITGGNLDNFLIGACNAGVTRGGSIAVHAKTLEAFLKASPAEAVTLTAKIQTVEEKRNEYKRNPETGETKTVEVTHARKSVSFAIEADNATGSIECQAAEDYPAVVQFKGKPITIPGFAKVVDEVGYAMQKDENRPMLHGISLRPHNGTIRAAAADGFRLAVMPVKVKGKLEGDVLIPLEAAYLVKKLMADISLRYREDEHNAKLIIEGNGMTLLARAPRGNYPDYDKLIPKGGSALKVDTAELVKAVKLGLASQPDVKPVRLQTKGGKLIVSVLNNGNRTDVKVPAQGKVKIAFEGKYLLDLLPRIDDQMVMRTKGPESPAMVKAGKTIHLVMPMNVQW